MIGMFHWVHRTSSKPVHDSRTDDAIIDVEAARYPNQPRLEEARRRWIDKRALDHPDDID